MNHTLNFLYIYILIFEFNIIGISMIDIDRNLKKIDIETSDIYTTSVSSPKYFTYSFTILK